MKKIFKLVGIILLSISLTGCIKMDSFEGVNIHTTVYPIEYIANKLYGEYSTIDSIYPNGVNINEYKLNDIQLKNYSKTDLFIFNGLGNEKEYVSKMFNYNKNIKIIDSTQSMEYLYSVEELWLNPSNLLMISKNIKNGLDEYIDSKVLKDKIEENYNNLKLELSNLDAKIKLVAENADNKTIVTSSDLYKFLEKYGFNVISLEENDTLTSKTISDVKTMIKNGTVKHIFLKQNEEISGTINNIKEETNVELITLHSISNLNDNEHNEKKDYFSIMNDNLELLKKEIYK